MADLDGVMQALWDESVGKVIDRWLLDGTLFDCPRCGVAFSCRTDKNKPCCFICGDPDKDHPGPQGLKGLGIID